MTLPTDIDSFAFGFDLTAAAYSGGAGGTFANLKAGGEDWKVESATPSFSTEAGLEGMDFTALLAETIAGQHRALYECTVVAIQRPDINTVYQYGSRIIDFGTYHTSSYNQKTFISGYGSTAIGASKAVPYVSAATWSPQNGTTYAQVNDGTVVATTAAAGDFNLVGTEYPDASIGRHNTVYYDGWIARVLVFDRALHFRDNTNLQLLIATEMAKIGL